MTSETFTQNDYKLIRVTNNYKLINFNYNRICNFNFIIVIAITKDKEYDITNFLKNSNHTYYVVDTNLFNRNFNKWLCMNYLKTNCNISCIKIIDNNANHIQINNNQYITLGFNSYHIKNYLN